MRVGVIKEMKDKEHRVALTPAGTTSCSRPVTRSWSRPRQDLAPAFPMRNTWQPGQPLSPETRHGMLSWC